jgi:hypothetical protein
MSELFLHPIVSGKSISDIYRKAFAEASELHVLSAYLTTWDTGLKINDKCKVFSFIVGKDFGITRKQACRDVLKWLPSNRKSFFFVAESISGFHPKALFWRTHAGKCYSLVGSSNLSDAGWRTNYEANVSNGISAKDFAEVTRWLLDIQKLSLPMSPEWLESYAEAPSVRKKAQTKPPQGSSPAKAPVGTGEVILPTFPGQAVALRERRRKKKAFTKLRPVLLAAIRKCASGSMTNKQFYNQLEKTWGTHEARIQGWGWQVTGRRSNFRLLCDEFVKILDASQAERDTLVVRAIDRLRQKKIPTRRSLLSEFLCLFFPADYPVLNKPIAHYTGSYVKAPRRSSEGARYLHLASSLRASLKNNPSYPAKDLLELDGMIWKYVEKNS